MRIARHMLLFGALAGLGLAEPAAAQRYSASITRTEQGVPHVVARDYGGLGYGSGYAAAEDNGCVIAETLVTVRGERARFFGKDAKVNIGFRDIPNLDSDIYHRAIGDLETLRAAQAETSRDNRAIMLGFAAGYNRFLEDRPGGFAAPCRGAEWLRPMTADDTLLLINAAMTLISSAPFAGAVAGAAPPGAPAVSRAGGLPDPAAKFAIGSNGWAFGADKTSDKRGLLVGNPHFPWAGPNRFRRLHLTLPGKLDVMGGGLIFMPTVGIGFNRDVAWTHTVTTASHVTLFQLALDPADPTRYLVDGQPEAMRRRDVTIEVKDGAPVTRTLYSTRYGLVVAMPSAGMVWSKTIAFALRDADQANLRSGDTWLEIGRARSVAQIRDIIGKRLGIPWINTIAADRRGNALYADVTAVPNVSAEKLEACASPSGLSPIARSAGVFLLDGARAACDWDVDPSTPLAGLMPLSRQAHVIRRDYVQNSNDSYWLANPAAPFAAHSPLLGPHAVEQNLRTRSGIGVIEAAGTIDAAKARGLVLENRVLAAELVLPDLLKLCATRPALADACAVLAAWDGRADNESKGALLFFSFWNNAEGIPSLFAISFDPASPVTTPNTLNIAGKGKEILDALQKAVDQMASFKVAIDAPLGSVQVAPRGDERIPIHGGPGNAGVLNAMHPVPGPQGLVPFHGTSYVQVVGFDARGPVAQSLLSYSQSTNPESPWFADGTRAYSQKRWLALPFTRAQVEAARVGDVVRISE